MLAHSLAKHKATADYVVATDTPREVSPLPSCGKLDDAPVVKSNSSGGLGVTLVQLPLPQLFSQGEAKDLILTLPLASALMLQSTCLI